jgi:penicillin-binding protein 1A
MFLPMSFARPLQAARRLAGRANLRARLIRARVLGPRWPQQWSGAGLKGTKWVALGLGGFIVLFTAHRLVSPTLIWPAYEARHERALGTALYDAKGRFLGILPGQLDPAGDYDVDEDHKALRLHKVPVGWWQVLVALEDEHFGGWRSWGGIDFVAVVAGFSRFGLKKIGLGSRRGRGGSSLAMQLVRSINHIDPSRSNTFARKLLEMKDAPILYDALGTAGFKRWLAMHVPLVTGTRNSRMGQPIYGIRAASLILYGKEPKDLNLAQQAVFAAAFKQPILVASDRDHRGLRARDIIWWKLKLRAALGILKASRSETPLVRRLRTRMVLRTREKPVPASGIAPIISGEEAAALEPMIGPVRVLALKRLGGMPAPTPQISPDLEPLLPADANKRFRVIANPTARALYFARPMLSQVIGELQDSFGRAWREQADTVRLTVDVVRNAKFVAAVRRQLARYQRDIGAGISLPLTGRGAAERAQVVVAIADANARLVLFFQNAEDRVYGGDQWKRDARGRYDPSRENRHIASLGKVLVALHLAQVDPLTKRYCNTRYKRPSLGTFVRNASAPRFGYARCRGVARVTPRQVFARSLNLPLIHRLSYREEKPLRRLVKLFGFRRVQDATLKEALPLGIVSGAPRTSHRMMHTVALGVSGAAGRAALPYIIASVQTWSAKGGFATAKLRANPADSLPGYRRYFVKDTARDYLRTVLSAPVSHPRGTFRALNDITARCNRQVDLHLAKTGTSTTHTGETRDKFAAGAVRLEGRLYSYFAMIGAGNPHRRTIGNDIRHPHLAGLLRLGLKRLGHGKLARCGNLATRKVRRVRIARRNR